MAMGGTTLAATSVALGSLYLLRDQLAEGLENEAVQDIQTGVTDEISERTTSGIDSIRELRVPKDTDALKELLIDTAQNGVDELDEEKGWISEKFEQISPDALDKAFDSVSKGLDDLSEFEVDPVGFLEAATSMVAETYGSTKAEILNDAHLSSIQSIVTILSAKEDSSYTPLLEAFERLERKLNTSTPVTEQDVQNLVRLCEGTNVRIRLTSDQERYTIAITDEDGISQVQNLFVNPALSQRRQLRLGRQFGTGDWGRLANPILNDSKILAQKLIDKVKSGSYISMVGGTVYLNSLSESTVVGPYHVFRELLKAAPLGEEFQLQETLIEVSDMVVPAITIGVIHNLAKGKLGVLPMATTTGKILASPVIIPLKVGRALFKPKASLAEIQAGLNKIVNFPKEAGARWDGRIFHNGKDIGAMNLKFVESRQAKHDLRASLELELSKSTPGGKDFNTKIGDLLKDANISEDLIKLDTGGEIIIKKQGRLITLDSTRARDIQTLKDHLDGIIKAADAEEKLTKAKLKIEKHLELGTSRFEAEKALKPFEGPKRTLEAKLAYARAHNPNQVASYERLLDDMNIKMAPYEAIVSQSQNQRLSPEGLAKSNITIKNLEKRLKDLKSTHGLDTTTNIAKQLPTDTFKQRRLKGAYGMAIGAAGMIGAGKVISEASKAIHHDNVEIISDSSEGDSRGFETALERKTVEVQRAYSDLEDLYDPTKIKNINNNERARRIRTVLLRHDQNIQDVKSFVTQNQRGIKSFFENNIRVRSGFNTAVELGEYFKIQTNKQKHTVELKYISSNKLGTLINDNFNHIKSNADLFAQGKNASALGEIGKAGQYMIPVWGSVLDSKDSLEAFKRGDFRKGWTSASFAAVGLACDTLWLTGIGGTLAEAGRGGIVAVKGAKLAHGAAALSHLEKTAEFAKGFGSSYKLVKEGDIIARSGSGALRLVDNSQHLKKLEQAAPMLFGADFVRGSWSAHFDNTTTITSLAVAA